MRFAVGAVAVAASLSAAQAADFWVKKPYGEWSEKEVQKLLTASPWAQPIPMQLKSTEARDAGAYKAGVVADERFGVSKDTQYAKATLNLVWNGRTIRMAQVRQRQLKGAAADAEKDGAFIDGPDKDSYVFVLQAPGFPALQEATVEQLQAATTLVVGAKDAARTLTPSRVEKPEQGQGAVAVFFFPRGEKPIDPAEGTATFQAKVGEYDVTRGFQLEDMVGPDGPDL